MTTNIDHMTESEINARIAELKRLGKLGKISLDQTRELFRLTHARDLIRAAVLDRRKLTWT